MIPRYPLTWPDGWKRITDRKRALFSSHRSRLSVFDGYKRILVELECLGVGQNDVVISTNIQTRLDGMPRSDRGEPADPGVAVYWESRDKGMRTMAVDRYDRAADNMAAIAATLEALRAIERHGGAAILERVFTGFDALPPPKSCWDVLGCNPEHATVESVQAAFKSRLRSSHPDAGGLENAMSELNVARDQALKILKDRQ